LSLAISSLLREGRAEAAIRLLADAENHGTIAAWATCDQVATSLLHLGRPVLARSIWQRASAPPSPAARQARIAASELAALDFPAAQRSYEAALVLDPDLGEAWLGLALLQTEQGDASGVLAASREGLRRELTPEQKSFLRFLGALAAPYAAHP
jgi:cytochrome c-type biogenesis protein CcmH/NrfG